MWSVVFLASGTTPDVSAFASTILPLLEKEGSFLEFLIIFLATNKDSARIFAEKI
jgi:hypothetical protein